MNAQDLQAVCKYVYQQAGIVLDENKEYLVSSRLRPLLGQFGFSGVPALVQALRGGGTVGLGQAVVEAVTTNETSFLRDRSLFTALVEKIVPDVIEARRMIRHLNIWSAASSSGQELYSIKILLKENFPELDSWRLRFIATDIDEAMLERVRRGWYSEIEVKRGLPPRLLDKYFDAVDGGFQVHQCLRINTEVRALNLHQPWRNLPTCDIIFLRNVLIYFDRQGKADIMQRAAQQLSPAGCVILGASESTAGISNALEVNTHKTARFYTAPTAAG